ncbi:MAG: DUF3891 family protein [Verrucomicrobia bacterium]|nr:DUF3891 family protein [Verrucomicrobiota bacterium]
MIRIATDSGYTLVTHQEHARLAGRFAAHWGNACFPAPAPAALLPELIFAVASHDDAWAVRDATPFLTRESRPAAFTRELVGAYSAFEEIDIADYLAVRGAATEAVAAEHPFAAILISMHTVNLLTEQADLSTIAPADRPLHAAFIEGQLCRQRELAAVLPAELAAYATTEQLQRGFEFLQFCDNLSLLTCVGYDQARPLRHTHPDAKGTRHTVVCTPRSGQTYHLAPWPFDQPELSFAVPSRHVPAAACADLAAYRAACAAAPFEALPIHLVS